MTGIKEFRNVMDLARRVAQHQEAPVSPEHVAFALAVCGSQTSRADRAVIEYGEQRGWPTQPKPTSFGKRFLHRRRLEVEPRLQQEIERAAAGGAPDIRAVLWTLRGSGELAILEESVKSTGQTLQNWLGASDE